MPYRIDVATPPPGAYDRLIDLGALDIEMSDTFRLSVILPDTITPADATRALGPCEFTLSEAISRDDGSVWLLTPRPLQIGGIEIVPPGTPNAPAGALILADSPAFGTGHHPTTALCLEAIAETCASADRPARMLDIGIGTGILALAALKLGVDHVTGIDIDPAALEASAENARLNCLTERLELKAGGPGDIEGNWPVVVANVLAAPLIELAPVVARRLSHRGLLILSGIPVALELEVARAYQRCGVHHLSTLTRNGWTALLTQASW